jgi:parvulin-like peptidyl-prolyl isomerase
MGEVLCEALGPGTPPAWPAAAAEPAAPAVVAKAGDTAVTRDELRAHLETLDPAERAALARDPALLSQAVRTYLARRLVVKAAEAKGWDRKPEVQVQLQRIREEALEELYLQSVSQPPAGYPSDAEVRAAYEARPAAFVVPPQYRVAQIFVAVEKMGDRQAEEKARARVDAIVKKLRAKDADFAAIARESSDQKASAENGGEIGWLTEGELVPGIRAAVVGLSMGAISAPVRLDEGWHVLKLLDIRPASRQPLAAVREALVAQLRAERAQADRRAYIRGLLEQDPPAIDEGVLSTVLPPSR